jgi:hypothetical protein
LDVTALARLSEGFSGAEIRETVVAGLCEAFHNDARELCQDDLERELRNTVPLSKTRGADVARMRAWARENARMAQ